MKHVQIGKLVSVYLKKLGRSRYQAHAYYKDVQRDASGGIVSVPYTEFIIEKGDREWLLWNPKGVEVVRDTTAQALINVLVYGDCESIDALAEQEFAAL